MAPEVIDGERAQRNDREPMLARKFDASAHQLTSESMPCELGGDFRVNEDELARHTPICEERGLTANVRLEAVTRLVVRDIEDRVRLNAHGPGGRIARGE